ncbi:site-specific integrase [Flavobacterium sp.]|uniref:site-specific integrase n=1 Tax=Flavobacterium sp. TaxID=239 RepID=UPI0037BF22BC
MEKSIKNNSGVVRFAFKETNVNMEKDKKKESPINLIFSYGGKKLKYSTGFKACYDDWDFNKQRIKSNKSLLVNAREVNNLLNFIDTSLTKEYSKFISEQIEVTNELLKSYLDKLLNKNTNEITSEKDITFIEFAYELLENKKKRITIETYKSYRQTLIKLEMYSKVNKTPITFNSFDKKFVNLFSTFLEEYYDHQQNSLSKHFKNLKTYLIEAVNRGLISNSNFIIKDFCYPTEETTAIYLTEKELQKMFDADLSQNRIMELARDIFLIGCYIGQRVSDYNGLTENDIVTLKGIKYFKIRQSKTKTDVLCPITKEISEIMRLRHFNLPPKKLNEPDINENIKELGKSLGFTKKIKCEFTKGGKKVIEMVPKNELIMTHTARRSFCTNMYLKKMPVFDIMVFSGHKTEKEFYKYIRIKGEERAEHIVGKGFFNI